MKRLTEIIDGGQAIPRTDLRNCGHNTCMNRLAAYEDTGLDPEQIRELDKLYAELCKELAKYRWISVTERLPQVEDGITDEECPEFIVVIKDATVSTTLKYSPDGTWFDDNGYVYCVVAWMPLPKPYGGGRK